MKATGSLIMNKLKFHKLSAKDEVGYFKPKTWAFWRSLITSFCILCILGHWLEGGYCLIMNSLFGIVEPDYAIWIDPWYHPYWVYGFGAIFMTLFIEPLKESFILKRKTLWGALLQTFVITVILSMLMELIFGLLINQPDEFGEYPYWDNSELPLNILGQAWLVNDFFIGFGAVVYVWLVYPLICEMFIHCKKPKNANILFGIIVGVFVLCCIASYTQLILGGVLG